MLQELSVFLVKLAGGLDNDKYTEGDSEGDDDSENYQDINILEKQDDFT